MQGHRRPQESGAGNGGWGVRGGGWPQQARAPPGLFGIPGRPKAWGGPGRDWRKGEGPSRCHRPPRPRPQESERAAGPRAAPGSREQEAPGAGRLRSGPGGAGEARGLRSIHAGTLLAACTCGAAAALHLPPRATGGEP